LTAEVEEVVWAFGHQSIQATHPTTLMITKDAHLSETGDCIIAVAADKSVADLSEDIKEALRKPDAQLIIQIEAGDLKEQISAHCSPKLTLTHPTDMVIRKSSFVCSRTLTIHADKVSSDLSRELVAKLKNADQTVKITLKVRTG
jgi:hypothetical protein